MILFFRTSSRTASFSIMRTALLTTCCPTGGISPRPEFQLQ